MSGEGLNWSTVYSMLSHSKRRALLDALKRNEKPMAMAYAAEEVVRLNSGGSSKEIGQERIEQCYHSLYHLHVPKLSDEELVTMAEGNTVALTEKGKQIIEAQEQIDGENTEYR